MKTVESGIQEELGGICADGRSLDDFPNSANPLVSAEDLPRLDKLNLFGLAFSGGGIRSAAFNLGVLESLEKAKLLPLVDYMSTVSGGGYTGAWYLSCLREGLRTEKQREPALHYLRKYSQYLAPQTGFFSADAWTIAMVWLRNTVLLQTMLVAFLSILLLLPRLLEWVYLTWNDVYGIAVVGTLFLATSLGCVVYCIRHLDNPKTSFWIPQFAAIFALLGAGRLSAALWHCVDAGPYCGIGPLQELSAMLRGWLADQGTMLSIESALASNGGFYLIWLVSVGVTFATAYTAWTALNHERRILGWRWGCAWIGLLCGSLCFGLCTVLLRIFSSLKAAEQIQPTSGPWLALFTGGPSILMLLSLCVTLQLGLLGREVDDLKREWWSRLAAFLLIYSVGPFAIGIAAVYGPQFVHLMTSNNGLYQWISGSITFGGVATTISGFLAARSVGSSNNTYSLKSVLALVSPYVFIAGLFIGVATGLQQILGASPACAGTAFPWGQLSCSIGAGMSRTLFTLGISAAVLYLLAVRVDINETSMNPFYRNRLVRCFQGAARSFTRRPNPFTGFDPGDDYGVSDLRPEFKPGGLGIVNPVPILNAALNQTGEGDAGLQERRAASYFFTPYCSGSSVTGVIETRDTGRFNNGIHLGWCIATSGAAASPNMGFHTSGPTAFLMTFFNVRLGLWIRNPLEGEGKFKRRWGFYYLLKELFATATVRDKYLYLSDGGHFENLGVYELVRRRCQYIVVGDAEQDVGLALESLGGVVRKCRIDFNVEIEINTNDIRSLNQSKLSQSHCSIGRIYYPDATGELKRDAEGRLQGAHGYLIYLKSSLTGDEGSDVLQYKAIHPEFPHETTADQFFSESQFESYRALGQHVAEHTFWPAHLMEPDRAGLGAWMEQVSRAWTASSPFTAGNFSHHTEQLNEIWKAIRQDRDLAFLDSQLSPFGGHVSSAWASPEGRRKGRYLCQSILQLMENAYLDLHLETEFNHLDNQGWKNLLQKWAGSELLRETYQDSRSVYGIRFQTFCDRELAGWKK